jgi:hypothetical protein
MDHEPLVKEQIEAGGKFLSEFDNYAPVGVAFWLKENERRRWYLYVVSDEITDENFDRAYGEVIRLANQLQDPDFDPFRVKVRGVDDPLAKAALEVRRHYGKAMIHLRDTYLDGVGVEEMYIYPPTSASVDGETLHTPS